MFCKHCGKQIPDRASFCPECGGAVKPSAAVPTPPPFAEDLDAATQNVQADRAAETPGLELPVMEPQTETLQTETPQAETPQAETPQAETPQAAAARKRRQWIAIGVFAVLTAAILIPVCIHAARQDRYDAAIALMRKQQYEAAAAEFLALKGFSDAPEQYQTAENHLAYTKADALRREGAYLAAREGFAALDDFEDAAARAAECQNAYDYDAADALRTGGDYAGAMDAFAALGDYADAKAQTAECGYVLDYGKAASLIEIGNYEAAAALLKPLAANGYSDAPKKLLYCNNRIGYAKASELFDEGLFFSAWQSFISIYSFEDAAERAKACIQEFPKASELYHNPAFEKKNSGFQADNRKNDLPQVFRLYTTDDVLVSTVCVPAGKRFTVRIPSGEYVIKQATGDDWFGEKEWFGTRGWYVTLTGEDGSTTFEFKPGYFWRITTNVSDEVANIGARDDDRNSF